MPDILFCPSCSLPLHQKERSFICEKNHTYDVSADGYLNLLLAHQKNSLEPGDTKEMLQARRAFLQKIFYGALADRIDSMCIKFSTGRILPVILDIGCGEGWYTRRIADALKLATIEAHILGVDISKTAVRLAAKDAAGIQYVVASMRRLPCMDQSIDVIVSIFAPLHFPEVRRVLKKDGKVIVVRPGQHHLQQFKSALGLTTLLHEEPALGEHDTGMKTAGTESVTGTLLLPTQDDIMNLCRMTPMFWRSSPDAQASLSRLQKLETDIDFHATVLSFKKLSVHAHRSRQAET